MQMVAAFFYGRLKLGGATMEQFKDDISFFLGIVVGAVIGGVAAAFLVPRSGPELREEVSERGLELTNRTEEAVQHARQVAQEAVAKAQQSMSA
jgi:gas vesicle protein